MDDNKIMIPLVQVQQAAEMEQAAFEKLPLVDVDPIKEGIERSPQISFFQSPGNLTGGNLVYGSPLGITFPFTGMAGGSPNFGASIDFTSLFNATSAQTGTSLKLPNSVFGSGNCSPCLFQTNSTPSNDYFYRGEDKDN